jgi:predicted RNase H-like HicB family nuclease
MHLAFPNAARSAIILRLTMSVYLVYCKDREVRMARQFTVLIERDEEGYYVADVPELKGCHTQARSLDELLERVKESIQLCLESPAVSA